MSERSALIVGPGNAFGFELARDLHAEGYSLAIISARASNLEPFSERLMDAGITHYVIAADVRDDSIKYAIGECNDIFPPWSVAIYNIKQSPHGNALSLNPSYFKESLDSNVVGILRLGQLLVADWKRTERATYILSGGGYKDHPDPNKLALGVAKGALHTIAAAMRPTYAAEGILVKEVVIDGKVDDVDGISPDLVARRYVTLTKSKRDTIVINEKSQ